MTEPIDEHFRSAIMTMAKGPAGSRPNQVTGLDAAQAARLMDCFDAQVRSRHVDFAARRLRAEGRGYYTISSAGHEANAIVAAALQPTDPALLHYRSGAFYVARAAQVPGIDGARDILLGIVAAAADPASGGRHKVFGRHELAVIPQTSTIASHLPRAVGVARAIDIARRIGVPSRWPSDAVVVASFGDASVNHSTCLGALNAAANEAFRGNPMPLLLVCEDNGFGISTRTPVGWVEALLSTFPGVRYQHVDGQDAMTTTTVVDALVEWVRERRTPAVLHLDTVRLMGHAGSDAEISYRTQREIEGDYARDPLLGTATALISRNVCRVDEILALYERVGAEIKSLAAEVVSLPRIESRDELMAPIGVVHPGQVRDAAAVAASPQRRQAVFRSRAPEQQAGLTLAQAINATLTDLMAARDDVVVLGEDVGVKGGVYGVTASLQRRFGADRVFDTILDEQTILGTALGAAITGLLPIPEIQYLAYLHNAEDQIRGEAATLAFFSAGRFQNGMVVRVAGLAYQQGFGGHFHNDNAIAVLRDIPGVVVAVPSSAAEAPRLLRACEALARVDGRVCIFLEPIALYHRRDLYQDGDQKLLHPYPTPKSWADDHVAPGVARTVREGDDLTIVAFGNGVVMSLRVAHRLAARGLACRVIDLQWLAPLPMADVVAHASATGRVLIVDETRRTAGVAEGVVTGLVDHGFAGQVARVASQDSFVPLGQATGLVLLDEATIAMAALRLLAS